MNEPLPDEESIFPEANIRFSTFGDRLGAYLIDGLIIIAATFPLTYFNVGTWKIPSLYLLIALFTVLYKPVLEYRYGATWGKMLVGLKVVGPDFGKITLKEEMQRVSFYLVPSILQHILTLGVYFSAAFKSTKDYTEFNRYILSENPSLIWINVIVFFLLVADVITFFANRPNRALHDIYAGTYVVEKN